MKLIVKLPNVARATVKQVQRGFTLIELMVVLVIIGLLAALIVPNVLDRADDARVTAAKTDVANLMQALKLYKLDNQRFPSAEQGLEALVKRPTQGSAPPAWRPYLDKLPADPWGRPYQYVNPGVRGEIDRVSQTLTSRVRELAERYENPLPQMVDRVAELEERVSRHLERMGFSWKK